MPRVTPYSDLALLLVVLDLDLRFWEGRRGSGSARFRFREPEPELEPGFAGIVDGSSRWVDVTIAEESKKRKEVGLCRCVTYIPPSPHPPLCRCRRHYPPPSLHSRPTQ